LDQPLLPVDRKSKEENAQSSIYSELIQFFFPFLIQAGRQLYRKMNVLDMACAGIPPIYVVQYPCLLPKGTHPLLCSVFFLIHGENDSIASKVEMQITEYMNALFCEFFPRPMVLSLL
jgi:hypothetical protein